MLVKRIGQHFLMPSTIVGWKLSLVRGETNASQLRHFRLLWTLMISLWLMAGVSRKTGFLV